MPDCKTPITSWEAVATRVPRPGFFLGDDHAACPLDNGLVLLSGEALPPSCDLGRLGVLPLELLHQITADVAESDPRALAALRNINRATAAVVDGMRDFATVAAFPRAMAALVLLAPGPAGTPIPLSALAACLRTSECACCRRAYEASRQQAARPTCETPGTHPDHPCTADITFGDCIYLLAPERVCYSCFRGCPEYLPASRPASATSSPQPDHNHNHDHDHDHDHALALALAPWATTTGSRPTSIRVPPGRYGVLSDAEQPTELYDMRQACRGSDAVADTTMANTMEPGSGAKMSTAAPHADAHLGQPAPIRYAAVIPGPYWEDEDEDEDEGPNRKPSLDRGYGCLACMHTDRRAGHRGWANPLTRYTKKGLQRHVEDPRFGGRVLTWRDAGTGIVYYEHDAPRLNRYPPLPEFGSMADMARRYSRGRCVPSSCGGRTETAGPGRRDMTTAGTTTTTTTRRVRA